MAIYSAQLAAVNCPADSLTLIYTVPPASGPAIVKQVGLKVEAGNACYIVTVIDGVGYFIAGYDNTLGAGFVYSNQPTWQVIPPGGEVYASTGPAGTATALVSGYQFSAP